MLKLNYEPEPLKLQGLGMNSFCPTVVLRSRPSILARLLLALGRARRARSERRAGSRTLVSFDRPSGEFTS